MLFSFFSIFTTSANAELFSASVSRRRRARGRRRRVPADGRSLDLTERIIYLRSIPVGPAYRFAVYHLMPLKDPCEIFPMAIEEVRN